MLKTAITNRQDIKTNSPNKTFIAEPKSLIELEIINKNPIPKLLAATTSANPLTKSNVSDENDEAMVSTEKTKRLKRTIQISSEEIQ